MTAVMTHGYSPVIVSVTECSYRDSEWLPNGIQIVLDHFSLVADSEPGNMQTHHS